MPDKGGSKTQEQCRLAQKMSSLHVVHQLECLHHSA